MYIFYGYAVFGLYGYWVVRFYGFLRLCGHAVFGLYGYWVVRFYGFLRLCGYAVFGLYGYWVVRFYGFLRLCGYAVFGLYGYWVVRFYGFLRLCGHAVFEVIRFYCFSTVLRKAVFCTLKGHLLYAKRPCFALRNTAFCKLPDCQAVARRSAVAVLRLAVFQVFAPVCHGLACLALLYLVRLLGIEYHSERLVVVKVVPHPVEHHHDLVPHSED